MELARPRKPQIGPVDAAAVAREVVALTATSGRAVSDVGVIYSGVDRVLVNADEHEIAAAHRVQARRFSP